MNDYLIGAFVFIKDRMAMNRMTYIKMTSTSVDIQ
jgi:hypothetical protein